MRFELSAYALAPEIEVIAPWRDSNWQLQSREACMAYAERHQIPVEHQRSDFASPYSMDANLLHISYEGGGLEDPAAPADTAMWRWTTAPEEAPEAAEEVRLRYAQGNVVAVDGEAMTPANVLRRLNALGGRHGIGRSDIVENRYVGMKSRGCYEAPGGTILLKAHRAMESITLDREVMHLKDELMPRYATLVYNGYWWAPERLALQALLTETQRPVSGEVRLKLYRGSVSVVGRESATDSLYDAPLATFEDDAGAYRQADATGFIRLNALRLRTAARRGRHR